MKPLSLWLSLVALLITTADSFAQKEESEPGEWKTVFFQRSFMGNLKTEGCGGIGGTQRMPVFIPISGSKVRVFVKSSHEDVNELVRLSFAKGPDRSGAIQKPVYPVLFSGQPSLKFGPSSKTQSSDVAEAAVTPGMWWLQQTFSSPTIPYCYSVNGYFHGPGDQHEELTLTKGKFAKGVSPGCVYRVDVFTQDNKPVIACYGDSITHGAGSSQNSGNVWPELVSRSLQVPVLNLGVNGDLAKQSSGMPLLARQLKGVKTVVYLQGINDIIGKQIKTRDEYVKIVGAQINELQHHGVNHYLGTLIPAGGHPSYDKNPAMETLRTEINEWIRHEAKVDGVIDFDAAVRDPAQPTRMKLEYQADPVHPNDLGYQKMAEVAIAALREAGAPVR